MYLHLGQSVIVPFREVIGIFDLDNTTSSALTRQTLQVAERNGQVKNVSEDLPKSFVLCQRGKKNSRSTFYLSQLSSATLLRRAESNLFEFG